MVVVEAFQETLIVSGLLEAAIMAIVIMQSDSKLGDWEGKYKLGDPQDNDKLGDRRGNHKPRGHGGNSEVFINHGVALSVALGMV